jgi:hypothetical protein
MKPLGLLWALTLLLAFATAAAEEAVSGEALSEAAETLPEDPAAPPPIIPLAPLLEIISAGELFWRPGWPENFPPDAFLVKAGRPLSLSLRSGDETLTLRRDAAGRLLEFPLFWDGAFIQIRAAYDDAGRLRRLEGVSPACPFTADVPEDFLTPGAVDPVRVNLGGLWYFALVREEGPALSETWYDEAGNFAAWYQARFRGEGPARQIRSLESRIGEIRGREYYDVDGGGRITREEAPRGLFSAQYRNGRPVYWDRAPAERPEGAETPEGADGAETPDGAGKFTLQWDERGLLTVKRPQGGGEGEFRYEYTLDGRENWTRRRDIEMTGLEGLLFPLFRGQYERRISYAEE